MTGPAGGSRFFQVACAHYNPEQQSLLIECSLGTIFVTGPKTWDFYDRFCSHRATLLKADGKDILAVTLSLRVMGHKSPH
jgi:hypothetical protein